MECQDYFLRIDLNVKNYIEKQNYVFNVQDNNPETTNINTKAMKNEQSCGFRMEKPNLPKFSGDM